MRSNEETAAATVSRPRGPEGRPASRSAPTVSGLDAAATVLVFGLLAGLVETGVWSFKRFWSIPMPAVTRDLVWMSPLANVVYCGALMAAALACVRFRPSRLGPRALVVPPAFVFFCGPLFLWEGLARVAAVVLALGLSIALARIVAADFRGFRRLARVGAVVLLLGTIAMGAWERGTRHAREEQALSALPPAAAGAPNVILLVMDTVRAQNLSVYGYERSTTPALEALAREGTLFNKALSTASWTLPSHASMFTGHYPRRLSVGLKSPLSSRHATLAEVLSSRGYATAGFVANTVYCSHETGLDRGFARYVDFVISPLEVFIASSIGRAVFRIAESIGRPLPGVRASNGRVHAIKSAAQVNREFLSWLDGAAKRPFFAFLNYLDAHDPYEPPASHDARYRRLTKDDRYFLRRIWHWHWSSTLPSERELQVARDTYDAAIAYTDEQIGNLASELRRRGLLQNTLLIITSDHGEHFGEHGLILHGNSVYRQLLHVPLIVRFPKRVPRGRVVDVAVSLRDLPATVTDLLALDGKVPPFPGTSLASSWKPKRGEPSALSLALSESVGGVNMTSLVTDGKHYVQWDDREELYDFKSDLQEEHNLAPRDPESPSLEAFRAKVSRIRREDHP